jgi:hypothetical protein
MNFIEYVESLQFYIRFLLGNTVGLFTIRYTEPAIKNTFTQNINGIRLWVIYDDYTFLYFYSKNKDHLEYRYVAEDADNDSFITLKNGWGGLEECIIFHIEKYFLLQENTWRQRRTIFMEKLGKEN